MNYYYRLHNPKGFLSIFSSFKLLVKNWILTWQIISQWHKTVLTRLLSFPLSFKSLFITFDILRKEILPANFVKIPEMIDFSIRIKSDFVKGLRNKLLFAPINIPIVFFSLFVLPINQRLLNTIYKKSFEF